MLRLAVVLLKRRITRREKRGYALRALTHQLTRRPKVQQYRRTVLSQHDVQRLDVPMHIVLTMHHFQARQQFREQPPGFLGREHFHAPQARRQGLARYVFQHQIRRTMRLKTTIDPVNMRMVKPRQHLRLSQKTLQTPLIVPRVRGRLRPHRPLRITHRKVIRQVFLNRHSLVQMRVMR